MGNQKGLAGLRDWGVKKTINTIYPDLRCPKCGFPGRIAFAIHWRNNGTISPIMIRKYMRIAVLHTGVYDRLFEHLEELLGISLEHILFEAQRNISRALFDSFGRRIPRIELLKKVPLFKRYIVEGFNLVAILSGMSYSSTLEYIPGKYGLARLKNPYNISFMGANVVGAFEFLEGRPFDYNIVDEGGNSYLVEVNAISEKPPISARLEVEKPVFIPGKVNYERCNICRAPTRVSSRLRWIPDEGKIIDTLSGSRLIMMDSFLLDTVFRELGKELGDDVHRMLIPAQRDWTIEHVELLGNAPGRSALKGKEFDEAFKGYLDDLPIFGYGHAVSFKTTGSKVEVVIENPFEEDVLAGTLQGLYEIFSKLECKVSWETRKKAVVAYTIEPSK